MLRLWLFFLLLVSSVNYAAPLPPPLSLAQQLQTLTDQYYQRNHIRENMSAVTLSVSGPQFPTPLTVFSGYTDTTNQQPIDADSLYQIASITKSFMAAIILQLEADPKFHLSINDKLAKYFPEYPKWGDITIKQLLNMTSGIPDYLANDLFWAELRKNPYKIWHPEEELALSYHQPLSFIPGTQFDYSNSNYILIGLLITKVTGHSVEEEMDTRFLGENNTSHLHLNHTYYSPLAYPDMVLQHITQSYQFDPNFDDYIPSGADVTPYGISYAGAAGGVISTPQDVGQWAEVLFKPNGLFPLAQLQELESLVSMQTGQPLSVPTPQDPYGFGLGIAMGIYQGFAEPLYNYTGMSLGFRSTYFYFPNGMTISVSVNSDVANGNNHILNLIRRVYHLILT